MENKKIECVYFDIGKTLVGFELERFAIHKNISPQTELKVPDVVHKVFDEEPYFTLERGLMSDDEYIEQTLEKIGVQGLSKEKFIEAFISIFFPNEGIVDLLGRVSENAKIAFISNLSPIHWKNYFSQDSIVREFFSEPWQQNLSFKIGARKPEKEIFLKALSCAGVNPKNALFFDDKQKNVEGFRVLGGSAERYDCTKDSIEDLSGFLSSYEVI